MEASNDHHRRRLLCFIHLPHILLLLLLFHSKHTFGTTLLPPTSVWESGIVLSTDAALHGPLDPTTYRATCETLGTNAYAIRSDGMCMQAHACQYEFCRQSYATDLPAYIVEAHTEEDIQSAVEFANEYNITVVVKSTGHSYHGASTKRDALLIWMAKYPTDGTIIANYTNSCDDSLPTPVVALNGGETWNDAIEAVKDQYHIVTGGGRTVGVAGWLQGSGLSFSSRTYGIGIDQVIDFTVVLANGTVVMADACTNSDLFWALRGGGGGTFGVVTKMHYRLHPKVPFVGYSFFLLGFEGLLEKEDYDPIVAFIEVWLKFWTQRSPTIDNRFSGFFSSVGAQLYFAGTPEEARAAFIAEFDAWYSDTLLPKIGDTFIEGVYGVLPPSSTETVYESWYDVKGGAAAYNDPKQTDATGDAYDGAQFIGARLVPLDTVTENAEDVAQFLIDLALADSMGPINYFLGGAVNDVDEDATAVHPAMRKAVWSLFTNSDDSRDKVIEYFPNSMTGACINHHSPTEPDWKNALWGADHYGRLLEIKKKYDPDHIFNCWHCVGYEGDEPKSSSVSRMVVTWVFSVVAIVPFILL